MGPKNLTEYFLAQQDYDQELHPRSLDFVTRMTAIFGDRLALPTRTLAICTRMADAEADRLSVSLANHSVAVLRLDIDSTAPLPTLSLGPLPTRSATGSTGLPFVDDCGSLQMNGVRGVPMLFRHFDLAALRPEPNLPEYGEAFCRAQWEHFMGVLPYTGIPTINLGRPPAVTNRIAQLLVAHSAGWNTPPTFISTDRVATDDFVRSCASGVVIKSLGPHFVELSPNLLRGVMPLVVRSRVEIEKLSMTLHDPETAPVFLQAYIPHTSECRVYVSSESATGYRLFKEDSLSAFTDNLDARSHKLDVGDFPIERCLRLAQELGMDYCAMDFLETADGLVFLEANINGDWLWLEQALNDHSVTDQMTEFLASKV